MVIALFASAMRRPNTSPLTQNQVTQDLSTLSGLLKTINETTLDSKSILKITDIHLKYVNTHTFNPSYFVESAKLFRQVLIEGNNDHFYKNIFNIGNVIIPENIHNFKRLVIEYLHSNHVHPFNTQLMSAFKELYLLTDLFEISIQSINNRTRRIRPWSSHSEAERFLQYQYEFIIEFDQKMHQSLWWSFCTPSFTANVRDIQYFPKFAIKTMQSHMMDITMKLRTRYIYRFLQILPRTIKNGSMLEILKDDVVPQIWQHIRILKEMKIWTSLVMIRDGLQRVRHLDIVKQCDRIIRNQTLDIDYLIADCNLTLE